MNNQIIEKEFKPSVDLQEYIDSYWFFENSTDKKIVFPVVPDGCSDIIFYLNESVKFNNIKDTFVSGVMEYSQLTNIPPKMKLFGIRFKPGAISYILKTNLNNLANKMLELSKINSDLYKYIKIDSSNKNTDIISNIENQLKIILQKTEIKDDFLEITKEIKEDPQISIQNLATKYNMSLKSLQRIFNKRIGTTPKKFSRIMRFQKAHNKITKEGLKNIVYIALSSGYFDQAHFNREYKKLTGFNPSHETMSILYNK